MNDPTRKLPTCPGCGTIAAPGESYCRNCGKPLLAATVAAPQFTPPPTPPPTLNAAAAQPRPINIPRKRGHPFLIGCLVFLVLLVVVVGAGGIYIWRSASYTAPDRQAPVLPERGAGTLTEFPVDSDPTAPAQPTGMKTEALGGTINKTSTSGGTKLPPGIDRTTLARGATSMTTATYKPRQKTSSNAGPRPGGDVYVCVLTAQPNQPGFGDGLATAVAGSTGGQKTGVRVQSPNGAIYTGTRVRSAQSNVYVLTKQGGEIVILLYSDDPVDQVIVDRLAQSVGNGQGLLDFPEVKASLWTLPASTPAGLNLVEIDTVTGEQIQNSMAGAGGGVEVQRILSEMKPFLPARLTGARYTDESRNEWVTLSFEYESSFQAWRTWILAKSALGLGGAEATTVREVNGIYLTQGTTRLLVFQKGPYLIVLSGPSAATVDRLVGLGNLVQV